MTSPSTTIPLHPPKPTSTLPNPLPTLLHTPSGLALLELQGTFNLPPDTSTAGAAGPIPVGRLHFPDYHPAAAAANQPEEGAWMKRVWMFVGEHQRLQGEVRKLPRAVGVLRRRGGGGEEDGEGEGELEVVGIVRYKVVFSSRPEPVGAGGPV